MLAAAYPAAKAGDFAYVTYNMSTQDPVFGGGAPEVPPFEQSSVAGTVELDKNYTINGIVTGSLRSGHDGHRPQRYGVRISRQQL